VVGGQGPCLLIYPLPDWEEVGTQLMRCGIHAHARQLQRLMVGTPPTWTRRTGRDLWAPNLRELVSDRDAV